MRFPTVRFWWLVPLILFILSGPIVLSVLLSGEQAVSPTPALTVAPEVVVPTQILIQQPRDGDVLAYVVYMWERAAFWWKGLPWYLGWPFTLLILAIIGPPITRVVWWVVRGVFRLSWGPSKDEYVPMRYTRELEKARRRAKLVPVLVLTIMMVGGAAGVVFTVAPTGTFEWLAKYGQTILLLGVFPPFFIGLGLHFEKTLRQGYIPTWIGIGLAATSFILGIVRVGWQMFS